MQMIFQDPFASLNPRRKVGAAIEEVLELHGMQEPQARSERCMELLGQVGMSPEDAQRWPREFSGVMSGQTMHDIQIRFAAEVAHLIREKKWHRTQKLAELPNGGVELSLRLNHLAEIRRWILGWGSAATVLAPPELQQQIVEEAQRIIAQRT